MTASIRILTVASIDSDPSLLIVSPNGSKTLVNCGEGCQRSFLESTGGGVVPGGGNVAALRIGSVNRVCLTHGGVDATGGLPGMILTTADVVESAARERAHSKNGAGGGGGGGRGGANGSGGSNRNNHNRKRHSNGSLVLSNNTKNINNNGDNNNEPEGLPDLEIVGPEGTGAFLHSLRHFMRRDRFKIHAHEGRYDSAANNDRASASFAARKRKKKKFKGSAAADEVGFGVKSIPVECERAGSTGYYDEEGESSSARDLPKTRQVLSYLFATPPLPGKFLVDEARARGVPPGPLYGQLKAGRSVSFADPVTNEERTVTSEEVVAPPSPGVGVAVICCPDLEVLGKLREESALRAFEKCPSKDGNGNDNEESGDADDNGDNGGGSSGAEGVRLDVMVHLAPASVARSPAYRAWRETFGTGVEHIALPAAEGLEDRARSDADSPFVEGACGAARRSLVSDDVFPPPSRAMVRGGENNGNGESERGGDENQRTESNDGEATTRGAEDDPDARTTIEGRPMMDYVLMPRSRRGLNAASVKDLYPPEKMDRLRRKVEASGAIERAREIRDCRPGGGEGAVGNEGGGDTGGGGLGELIFTGTGSAVPCKHRNVTGMYLRFDNGNGMLLDIGEGTVGQLLRSWKSTLPSSPNDPSSERTPMDEYRSRLRGIKAVWISHPHADHHLGLLKLLSERAALCGPGDPIVLMAPHDMFDFLAECRAVVPEINDSYIPVDAHDMVHGRRNPLGDKLHSDLGITYCASIPVAHCPRSFAVVVDGTPFGRVAYSGDCRPSDRFADVARGTDLLIHEATFEDGMEGDARRKRHSTVGEAAGVAGRMGARALVLTHFSQRYPRIPPLRGREGGEGAARELPVAFAFDFMRLRPGTIGLAARLTPALRLLYPGEGGDEAEAEAADGKVTAEKELVAVPGASAAKGVA